MGVLLAALLAAAAALPMPAGAAEKFRPFRLKSVDGGERKLADVLGKATLVVFFFPTCAYCKVSLPEVQRLQDRYKEHGLTAVWINVLPQEDASSPTGARGTASPRRSCWGAGPRSATMTSR